MHQQGMKKEPKPKASRWKHFHEEEHPWIFERSAELVRQAHDTLEPAVIGFAWMLGNSPDVDGRLVLGKCAKAPELWAKACGLDYVIGLNYDWWIDADEAQRSFLIDHELCHAAPALDKEGDQKRDDSGALQWRTVKHDIEEFAGPVQRHGIRMASLQRFFEVATLAQRTLPFKHTGADVEAG